MNFWIVILCTLIAISTHELGHAFAMRRHGIKIRSICLLGLGPKILEFRLRRWFGDVPIEIRLIPVGAYVIPEPDVEVSKRIQNIPFLHQIDIYGAGINNNIAFGIFLIAIAQIYRLYESNLDQWPLALLITLGSLALIFVLLKWQKWISLSIPIIGFAFIYLIFFLSSQERTGNTDILIGPIETVKFFDEESKKMTSLAKVFMAAASVSFSLALGNCLPFLPFDGGHVANIWIQKLIGKLRYKKMGGLIRGLMLIPGLLLLVAILGKDLFRFISSFF